MLGTMMRRHSGLTLVELLLVVAVLGVVVAIAAPSFKNMILMQRLRGVSSELVTDLQFARSEAAARRDFVRIAFQSNPDLSCYTIYAAPDNTVPCDCRLGADAACSVGRTQIKTVQVPRSLGVVVAPPPAPPPAGPGPPISVPTAFAFDWRTGGIYLIPTDNAPRPMSLFVVESFIDNARKLNTQLNGAGRPLVCTPAGSNMAEASCPLLP